jgi:hypothetical protein
MAKPQINGPRTTWNDTLYRQECRRSLEPSFRSLIDAAAKAGWDRGEVAYALLALAADAYSADAPVDDPMNM